MQFRHLKYFLLLALASPAANAIPISSIDDPALNGATLWDFEELATFGEGTSMPISDPTGGVTFQPVDSEYRILDRTSTGASDGNGIETLGQFEAQTYDFVFDSVVSAVALDLGAVGVNWRGTAFDASGAVIEEIIWSPVVPCCEQVFQGVAAEGIARFRLTGVDNILMDNLHFVPQQVPEPGTLILFLAALAGMRLTRRKA